MATALLKSAFDFFFPIECVSCERLFSAGDSGIICRHCWAALERLPYPQCERCGHPVGKYQCRWCELLPPYVRSARSVCWMPSSVAENIVYALKYSGWKVAARAIVQEMAALTWPADAERERSLLVPVPLTKARERERGYNQARLLATELSKVWNVPVCDALSRKKMTVSQTRLTAEDRHRNVSGAFAVSVPPTLLEKQHIFLVDDVVTTAATLNSCAAALITGGARIISYVTFGRARAAGDRH